MEGIYRQMLRCAARVVYNQGVRQGTPHGRFVPKLAQSGELVSGRWCRGVVGKRQKNFRDLSVNIALL